MQQSAGWALRSDKQETEFGAVFLGYGIAVATAVALLRLAMRFAARRLSRDTHAVYQPPVWSPAPPGALHWPDSTPVTPPASGIAAHGADSASSLPSAVSGRGSGGSSASPRR